jgi:hypothetical protein
MASRVAVNGQAVTLARPGTPLPDVIANWPKEMYSSPDGVHLLGYWGALLLCCALCLLGTYAALRRGDVGISKRAADGLSRRTWLLLTVPPVVLCSLALLVAGLHATAGPEPPATATPGCGQKPGTQLIGGYCVGPYRIISNLPLAERTDSDGVVRQAHHIIQDAAVNQVRYYSRSAAPAVLLRGGTNGNQIPPVNPEHYLATQPQLNPCKFGFTRTFGTYGLESQIGLAGLRHASIPAGTAGAIVAFANIYFSELGVTAQTPTGLPGNRKAHC